MGTVLVDTLIPSYQIEKVVSAAAAASRLSLPLLVDRPAPPRGRAQGSSARPRPRRAPSTTPRAAPRGPPLSLHRSSPPVLRPPGGGTLAFDGAARLIVQGSEHAARAGRPAGGLRPSLHLSARAAQSSNLLESPPPAASAAGGPLRLKARPLTTVCMSAARSSRASPSPRCAPRRVLRPRIDHGVVAPRSPAVSWGPGYTLAR